jgi:hypothetical protein
MLLQVDLGSQILQVLVSLLEDRHDTRVLLSVDQLKVFLHVVGLQGLDTLSFFAVHHVLGFFGFLVEVGFRLVGFLLYFACFGLMELKELLLPVKNLLNELLPPRSPPQLLT